MTVTSITALQPRTAAAATLATVTAAADLLNLPCTLCTCRPVAVRALDVDPDCPGLTRGADGCRVDTLFRARLILATELRITVPNTSRHTLRHTLDETAAALAFAPAFTDAALASALAGLHTGMPAESGAVA